MCALTQKIAFAQVLVAVGTEHTVAHSRHMWMGIERSRSDLLVQSQCMKMHLKVLMMCSPQHMIWVG